MHLRPLLLNFFVNYESFIAKYAPFDTPQMDDQILLGLNRAWRCVYYHQGVQPTEDEVVIENGAVEGPNVTLPAARQHFVAPFLARCVAEMSQALPVEQAEATQEARHWGKWGRDGGCKIDHLVALLVCLQVIVAVFECVHVLQLFVVVLLEEGCQECPKFLGSKGVEILAVLFLQSLVQALQEFFLLLPASEGIMV